MSAQITHSCPLCHSDLPEGRMAQLSKGLGESLVALLGKTLGGAALGAQEKSDSSVRAKTIMRVVAEKYAIDASELRGRTRAVSIAVPRSLAMYLCCAMTELSSTDIGRAFGGKDHSTVLHARKKIEKKIEEDPFFLELINRLQADIKAAER